ncbi:aminodeoxychorismate synthase [Corynebacterium aurimucosum]|uniref:aminodeoxychorismate synthase n=1 Tax=Corynebacterium aurimucosum TaxID=169292 RepID=UPI00066A59AA|nr:aminodeoxychorismate synthase [Corynebacterium aurimucosum]
MDFDSQQQRLLEDVVKLAAGRKRAFKPVTVLIDGPSGAGKTWTSAALAERTNWRVVHLDEFYPGWHGLDKGSDMVAEQVLRTMNPGYWRWDWEADTPGDWASLDVRDDLIVEGVGSVTPANIAAAKERGSVVSVFIDGPRDQRRERAIAREPDYEQWFETWEAQEKDYFATKAAEADLVWEWS